MFDQIGEKIKTLAVVITILGIIVSCVAGIALCIRGAVFIGILIVVIGSLTSWLGSFLLYGFGQLISNTDILVSIQTIEENEEISPTLGENLKTHIADIWNICPHCGESLVYSQDEEKITCPWCGKEVDLKDLQN